MEAKPLELSGTFEVAKHDIQFTCEWAVYPQGGENSICYCTDEVRARMVAQALNEMSERQRLATSCEPPTCPYCGEKSERVRGSELYPTRSGLANMTFFLCRPCDARVGTNKRTGLPLGVLANRELRKARMDAHEAFDPLWEDGGEMTRSDAYAWLSKELDIPEDECHLGKFNLENCQRAIEACQKKRGLKDDLPF